MTGGKLDETFRAEQFKRYLERCEQQPILAGVKELLQEARERKIKLAVASSSRREWVERWLKQHDLRHFFNCIRTREDVKMGKPAPDLYISAAECLGIPIERCLAIEDSPNGMNAALAAGMRCLAVPNTLTLRLKRPEVSLTLKSLADLDLKQLLAQF
jgi:HAD superfamily hydrolase (TIGR01509 family)